MPTIYSEEYSAIWEMWVQDSYYERWLASLEKLAIARGFVTSEEIDARTAQYASGERDDDDE